MIIKLQRPLGGDRSNMLAYDESRTVLTMLPADDPKLQALFREGEAKVYLEARVDRKGVLHLGVRAQNQEPGW